MTAVRSAREEGWDGEKFLQAFGGSALLAGAPVAAGGSWETSDIVGQGPGGPVVATGGPCFARSRLERPGFDGDANPGQLLNPTGPTGKRSGEPPEAFSL